MTLTSKIKQLEKRLKPLKKRFRVVDMRGPGGTEVGSWWTDGGRDEDTGDREVVTVNVIYEKGQVGGRNRP